MTFPFNYVVRNVGIGSLSDSQLAPNPAGSTYMFSGVQVHSTDLDAADSAHVVVGHRGNTKFTFEGKNTVGGSSPDRVLADTPRWLGSDGRLAAVPRHGERSRADGGGTADSVELAGE